ncbi:MAG: hypothetical protein QM831_42025 [Kofleriaceae bacterium]
MTGLSVGEPAKHVCGTFTANPYDTTLASADNDRYRVTVTDNSPILVDVWVDDGLSALTGITIRIFDSTGVLVGQATPAFADHAAFTIALQPGDYDFLVSANATGELAGTINYRLRFETMPACDEGTGDPNYQESTGANGAINVDFSKDPSFTMDSGSSPESSGLSFDPQDNKSIGGSLDTTAGVDQYADRDTYEITTGDATNELAIRLTWDGATDVDYIVFEADTMIPIIASNASLTTGPELQMFAVKPKTKYWVWVGAVAGGASTNYRATVCGWKFFY